MTNVAEGSALNNTLGWRAAPGASTKVTALSRSMIVDEGGSLDLSTYERPMAAAALALLLKAGFTGSVEGLAGLMQATDYVFPAIEITDGDMSVVGDHGLAAAHVIIGDGGRRPYAIDLMNCGALVEVDGLLVSTGSSATVFETPSDVLRKIADVQVGDGSGVALILIGQLTEPVLAEANRQIRVTIGGLGSASLALLR